MNRMPARTTIAACTSSSVIAICPELTTYLKVGTTAVVLEMIEAGFIPPDFALRNPLQALKVIWRDLTCRKAVSLQNGRHYSALELQKAYLDLAHRYYSTHPVSATAADLLRRWEHVLTALAEDPRQLHQEIDWNYIGIGYLLNLWVKCQDPFQYENDKIAHLMRRLEGAPMVGG